MVPQLGGKIQGLVEFCEAEEVELHFDTLLTQISSISLRKGSLNIDLIYEFIYGKPLGAAELRRAWHLNVDHPFYPIKILPYYHPSFSLAALCFPSSWSFNLNFLTDTLAQSRRRHKDD